MRIIIFHTSGGVQPGGDTGGGTLHSIALSRLWAESGIQVDYITNEGDHYSQSETRNLTIYRLPAVFADRRRTDLGVFIESVLNGLFQRRSLKGLMSRLALDSCDCIAISANPFVSDVLAAIAALRRYGTPGVIYFHHLPPAPWWFGFRRGSITRSAAVWLYAQFTLVLVKIFGLGISLDQPRSLLGTHWRLASSVLSDDDFLPDGLNPASRDIGQPRMNACYIGRLSPNKGVLDAIRAWKRVQEVRPDARLIIRGVGSSPRFFRKMRETIRRLELEPNVDLGGYVTQEVKESLLMTAKLFLFPSYEEGWSLSVMEAARLGAIPLVYDLPAYDYLGSFAVRVPVGDVDALAAAAQTLLSAPDSGKATDRAAPPRFERYTGKHVASAQAHALMAILRESG